MNPRNLPVLGYVLNSLDVYGLTRTIRPTASRNARRLTAPGLVGVEDIVVDQEHAVAYLSAADRRTERSGGPERGGLFRLRLDDPDAVPERIDLGVEIYPHGISLWVAEDGRRELWAIDHAHGEHAVRRYAIERDGAQEQLRQLAVYTSPLIVSPNDLTVTGEGECYVTNDHGLRGVVLQALEQFARLPLSNVVRISDTGGSVNYLHALTHVPYANGIAWHPGRGEVYVAAMTRREIWRCTVQPGGRLRREAVFPTTMCVDNIEVDPDGSLWIGGHPKILQLLAHASAPEAHSASQVIRMDPVDGSFETFFEDDGSLLSGCSVGVRWSDRLLVGSVMEPFVLDHPVPVVYAEGR